jgi:predicted nucleic acid-binding protein
MIFVDTSFWVALHLRRDAHHPAASELLTRYSEQPMMTTNQVRGETWTVLRRRDSHRMATAFLDRLANSSRVELVSVGPDLEDEALTWLRRHDERRYSFVDATSFRLMGRRRITDALAFDGDYSAAGFVELQP